MQNKLLNLIPDCQMCSKPLTLSVARAQSNHDGRWYFCEKCSLKKNIRYNSFAEEFKCTLMELTRIIFYYYCRGYTVESVHKEMTHYAMTSTSAIKNSKQMILGVYAFVREMISERVIRDIREKKLGGQG